MAGHQHADVLTVAEWRVVRASQHGLSQRQIAERFGVSRDAVKFHVTHAKQKLSLADYGALRHWFGLPRDSALFSQETTVSTSALARATRPGGPQRLERQPLGAVVSRRSRA